MDVDNDDQVNCANQQYISNNLFNINPMNPFPEIIIQKDNKRIWIIL